jgi:hypothetical protein
MGRTAVVQLERVRPAVEIRIAPVGENPAIVEAKVVLRLGRQLFFRAADAVLRVLAHPRMVGRGVGSARSLESGAGRGRPDAGGGGRGLRPRRIRSARGSPGSRSRSRRCRTGGSPGAPAGIPPATPDSTATRAGPRGPSARPRGTKRDRSLLAPTRRSPGPARRPVSPGGPTQRCVPTGKRGCSPGIAKGIGARTCLHLYSPRFSPPTCSLMSRSARGLSSVSNRALASARPKMSSRGATRPVHPVWWLAPRPAPFSPWKYS